MIKEVIANGKDIAEARENARAALGAGPLDDVTFEVLHAGSKGIFGIIGVKPAQVKATMEIADKQERRPRPERRRNPRPEREEKAERTDAKPTQDTSDESTDEQKKPEHKSNKNRRKKKKPAQNNSTPRERVVPEEELTFEPLVVAEGEDLSYELIKTLIRDIGLNAEAALFSCEDGTRRINISGQDASALIGHHGDTLDALQYLANLASAQKNVNGERIKSRVTIDIEGYRAKREEALRALARRMAAKALRNRRSVMLEPMSAYERRIIHSEIQGIEGVSTNSIGSDNNRKIVIFLTDKKPKELFEEDQKKHTPLREEFAPDEDALVDNEEATEISACICEDPACETCEECVTDVAVERVVEETEELAETVEDDEAVEAVAVAETAEENV